MLFEWVGNGGLEKNKVLSRFDNVLVEGEGAWVVSNFLANGMELANSWTTGNSETAFFRFGPPDNSFNAIMGIAVILESGSQSFQDNWHLVSS